MQRITSLNFISLLMKMPSTQHLLLAAAILLISTQATTAAAIKYSVRNTAATTPGGVRFEKELGAEYSRQVLSKATAFIWSTFQQSNPADRKPIHQISLFIDDTDGVAYIIKNEIHASARWIRDIPPPPNFNLKRDFEAVMYHQMATMWQWNGKGKASVNVTTGIADFVRLKAGYAPYYWVKPGEGSHWDEGYDVTARFLDYCDGLKSGFVAQLNKKMRYGYNDGLFRELTGKSVDQLWRDYKAKYGQ